MKFRLDLTNLCIASIVILGSECQINDELSDHLSDQQRNESNDTMDQVEVKTVTRPMILGEGPFWMENDQSLVFVDHPGKSLNRYFSKSDRLQVLNIDGLDKDVGPSFVIPVNGVEAFLVGLGHDISLVQWSPSDPDQITRKATSILRVDENNPTNSLNDAKVDPQGRLWTGTKGQETSAGLDMNKGTLYRIDNNLNVSEWAHEVSISNGMTWSMDRKHYYYIDSPARIVDVFDYDDITGEIKNRRNLLNLEKAGLPGYPDGMTIDTDGNLWVACYDGHQVLCIDPNDGKVLRKVRTPSRYTTSCCFGGEDYSTLYVTTASRWMSKEDLAKEPDSGKTVAIKGLGVKGLPERGFSIDEAILKKYLGV